MRSHDSLHAVYFVHCMVHSDSGQVSRGLSHMTQCVLYALCVVVCTLVLHDVIT